MKTLFKALLAVAAMIVGLHSGAQDFSNRGKEFWLAYSYHVGMTGGPGASPTMTLYLTADQATTYTVEIFGGPIIQTGSIAAGQVINLNIPNIYFINSEGTFNNKAIRVTSVQPIVVYSYITRSAASGATLCLPVTVLGKEYVAASFTQASNEGASNSYFTIIAVEDNTTVEITPSGNTTGGWQANQTYTVNLNKGQIYQVLGALNPSNNLLGVDLTGSLIKSVASGTGGCKRIAVFSGSGKIRIPQTCNNNSSDNLYQQLYPVASWGRKYLTVPSRNNPNNYFRIIITDPSTVVTRNGVLIPGSFFTNGFYTFQSNQPNLIEADKPICVLQYFTTQGCDGNTGQPNDPDMIVLNPVEQNIDKVTLVNSNLFANPTAQFPHQHHIHVVIKNSGTAISSFLFDNSPVPASSWQVHPGDPTYSYLYLPDVSQGYHRLSSDSGFNALAYGYANAESYGYSAGANVKDLYQFVLIQNQFGSVPFPATCRNAPFYFSMVFPYQPNQITWQFNGLFPDVVINNPVFDSTWTLGGKQLYRYKLTTPYTIGTIGTFPIKVLAQNPTSDGCSGEQEINYELEVFERPSANFNFTSSGCLADSVHFTDVSNTNGRPSVSWHYNFGDNNTSSLKNPAHLYASAGSYQVNFHLVTDIGCLSDTISKLVQIAPRPVANFGFPSPVCKGQPILFSDSSTVAGSTIAKWTWTFGDGSPTVVLTNSGNHTHTYANPGTYTVTLKVESASGCESTVFSKQVTVQADPVADFSFGNGCLPQATVSFTNNSSVPGGGLQYLWDFGNGTFSQDQHPQAVYTQQGPFNVKLVVTSPAGCRDSITKPVNTIFQKPSAQFTSPDEICLGAQAAFTSQGNAPGSAVTQWNWNFGNSQSATGANTTHTYAAAGTYQVAHWLTSAAGCQSDTVTRSILVMQLPLADFTLAQPACAGKVVSFNDQSQVNSQGSIISRTWNFGDGTPPFTTASNGAVTHTYAAAGNYTVTLQVITNKGCTSLVKSLPITIHPNPVPDFIMPDNCLDDPFSQFLDNSTIVDGSQGQFSYLWNFGDPNATPSNPNTSVLKDPKHKYSVVGPYTVSLTVTSSNGCVASVSKQFFVNGTQPQSSFTINGGNQHCSNQQVSITNNATVDVGSVTRITIQWDYLTAPNSVVTVNNPAAGSVYNHDYPVFYTPATRDVTIRVVAYSGDSCFHESTRQIVMKAAPQISFNSLPSVCANLPAFNLNQASVTNIPGNGIYSGPGVGSNGSFNPAAAGTGNHTIRYSFTGTNGCSDFREQNLQVFAVPQADAGPDKFVLEGGNATLNGTGSGTGISYLWTPATWLNQADVAQPVTTPLDDISYTLTVTSAQGCTASDQVSVKLLKAPTIPNVFSPNGDGINDRWEIKYLDSYPGATVEIFNRYGQLVFRSVGYDKPWDGTYKGAPVPAGTYYYIINPKNGRKQISGFVDVVK